MSNLDQVIVCVWGEHKMTWDTQNDMGHTQNDMDKNELLSFLIIFHRTVYKVAACFYTCRTSLAEVTSDLEELQYRWQQIETCCRFDLGVCTSFLCNESTDSPIIQARLSGKVTSALGSASAASRESLPLHRVHTYPTFQSSNENYPPPHNTLPKHSVERHASDPSSNASERESTYEYQCSENGANVKRSMSDSTDGLNDSIGSAFNEQNVDSENSLSQQDLNAVHTGEENVKERNSRKNGSFHDDKDKRHLSLNSEDKNTSQKRKWWSRGKKHHSEEGNLGTNAMHLSRSKGSLPILTQK